MSLDDRMRQAYGRQLDDVGRRVGRIDDVPSFEPGGATPPSPRTRLLAVAAALLLVGVGVGVMVRLVDDRSNPVATDPAGQGLETAEIAEADEAGRSGTAGSASDDSVIQVEPSPSPETTGPQPSPTETTTGTTDTDKSNGGEPDGGDPDLATGVANDVCPTGLRAELERATTSYVGPSQGWNRKDDLVDEQDGPFYFQAWEPGYEGSVEVDIVLDQPVLANEVRVAQDPYAEVSGAITITIDGRSDPIELSGIGGWKTLTFAEPITLDQLRIRRDRAEADIVEILVCVEPARGS